MDSFVVAGRKVTVLAARTFRTGVQVLWADDGQHYVSIKNRSYRSTVPISDEKVAEWERRLA